MAKTNFPGLTKEDFIQDLCKNNGFNIVWIHHEEKDNLESLFKDFIK